MNITRNITNFEQNLVTDGHIFEVVQNVRYLGTLINFKNVINEEIKSRIAAGNRCSYSM
jgi:hypothetical protein